jgi:cytochrome P450
MSEAMQVSRPHVTDLDWYRTMRDTNPVCWDTETNSWNVFRYQDVAAVLADYHTFSSDFTRLIPDAAPLTEGNILAMDPPHHNQLRGLVSLAFSPRAIAELEGRVGELTETLLDQAKASDHIELVGELAYPLPVTVIAELLGVPAADRGLFKTWADALLDRSSNDRLDKTALAAATTQLEKFHDYLRVHVERRRLEVRRDLLGDLVTAEIDGTSRRNRGGASVP